MASEEHTRGVDNARVNGGVREKKVQRVKRLDQTRPIDWASSLPTLSPEHEPRAAEEQGAGSVAFHPGAKLEIDAARR